MVRRVEVRLVLLGAGLIMATAAGKPLAVADTFLWGMVAAMVGPICASMGFAAVLHATGCDRQLIQLLLEPIRRARWTVLPGGIIAAYVVNMAVPSQSSTAAALGPIVVPLMISAGASPAVAGAALVLGASFGGDLLSPGAQDVQSVAGVTGLPSRALSNRVIPASLAGFFMSVCIFAARHWRMIYAIPREAQRPSVSTQEPSHPLTAINLVKAIIPVVPIGLLLLAYSGLPGLSWLLKPPDGDAWKPLAGALPVVRAMLIGVVLAAAVAWRQLQAVTRSLFEGMGDAYSKVISLTVAAQCFGAGIAAIGLGSALLLYLGGYRWMLSALSIGFPWALAVLSGSGSGPVLAFAQTFLLPLGGHLSLVQFGALSCLAAAAGRTMSPVSAVVIYGSGLVGVDPLGLVRVLVPPLVAGAAVSFMTTFLMG